MSKQFAQNNSKLLNLKESRADLDAKALFIVLKTDNKNGGAVKLMFDISEIDAIRAKIVSDIATESAVALMLAIIVLGLLSANIISPIKQLSEYMSGDFATLDPKSIPAIKKDDETGELARSFSYLLKQTQEYISRLEQLSKNDPLTGLFNRRAFEEMFTSIDKQANSFGLGILYLDIDHFKRYNDTYGHNAGDIALQKVAKAIEGSLQRKGDNAFRLGGEEFAAIISAEDEESVIAIAERIRTNVEKLQIEHTGNPNFGHVTVSIGAHFHKHDKDVDIQALLEIADKALYNAKESGRNRVSVI